MKGPSLREHEFLIAQTRLLLDSFRKRLGRDLIERSEAPDDEAKRLFDSPFVVVSATPDPDPILNYGNASALELWKMDWPDFIQTPSKETAEPMHRAERQAFLRRVRECGYIDDYQGIRISSQGDRFEIRGAIVWNLEDADGRFAGQAATFSDWTPLNPRA